MLLHIIIRKSSKFYWLEQSYRKYYYSDSHSMTAMPAFRGLHPRWLYLKPPPFIRLSASVVWEWWITEPYQQHPPPAQQQKLEVVMSTCCSCCHHNRRDITAKQLQMTKSKWPCLNFSKSNTVAPKVVDIQTALLENFFFNRQTMVLWKNM